MRFGKMPHRAMYLRLLLESVASPQTPRVSRFGQTNKAKQDAQKQEVDPRPTSSPFLCPAQALGLALQHHPILLAGKTILTMKIKGILRTSILETIFILTKYNASYFKLTKLLK
tara:strand:- start:137 stop:478 length:342 start_codon:yes stop_codon:yes gene_type:complete